MATVTVSKWGNSLGLRIPKAVIASHSLQDGDIVDISTDGQIIKIEKVRTVTKHKLEDILGCFHTNEEIGELGWGDPKGNETW